MSKWHSLLEYLQFPLKVLFFGTVLLGIGSVITNPNLFFVHINNELIILIANLMRYMGAFIIHFFPFLVFIKVLSQKFESSSPVFMGVISYIVMNITMVFFTKVNYPTYFYESFLGIKMDASSFMEASPFITGIFGLIVCYYITKFAYKRSRHYSMHGILSFIDHDSWAMIITFTLSVLAGLGFAYGWPIIVDGTQNMFEFIGNDITNPINMFIYGVFERLCALFNMIEIPRNVFWFGELGGTWIDVAGEKYIGDIAIWTIQQSTDTINSAGRFITPYYVINIFIIPSFILAYYSLVSSKKDKGRYLLFILCAVLLSLICGNSLPVEILMLIISPILYLLYLFIVGMIFAVLQSVRAYVGYTFQGDLLLANPGSMIDLIQYIRNPDMASTLISVLVIGVICAIFFFYMTKQYFKKYAIGLFQLSSKEETVKKVITGLGGIDNIIKSDSTPDKLTVQLHDIDKLDKNVLSECGAYLILEADHGFLIRLGNISTIVGDEIRNQLEEKNNG